VRIANALGVSVEYLVTGSEISKNRSSTQFPPEIRHIAITAEKLKPGYRKIVMSFIETLNKHEDAQS